MSDRKCEESSNEEQTSNGVTAQQAKREDASETQRRRSGRHECYAAKSAAMQGVASSSVCRERHLQSSAAHTCRAVNGQCDDSVSLIGACHASISLLQMDTRRFAECLHASPRDSRQTHNPWCTFLSALAFLCVHGDRAEVPVKQPGSPRRVCGLTGQAWVQD